DYHDLAPLKRYIDESFDHRHLNDVLGHEKVTAECLARHFYEWCKARLPQTTAVRVSETPKTWAEYRP
ncbi:MAG: 6-carboxytetrahydropterin synthase QueD, partial [Mesorhizobium sp.]